MLSKKGSFRFWHMDWRTVGDNLFLQHNHRQMKQLYIIAIALLTVFTANAQTADLTVFTEMGENITVYINGQKKNDTPSNNVKIEGVTDAYFQVRIDFEDASMPDFSKNGGVELGTSTTYIVKPNKKGNYVLRLYNSQPLAAKPANPEPMSRPVTSSDPTPQKVETTVTTAPATTEVMVTETTTTTSTPSSDGESVKINMSVDGIGINVDMDIDDMEVEESTTVTTTTTTSSTSMQSTSSEMTIAEPVVETVAYDDGGCRSAMASGEFDGVKRSIAGKSFEDSKFTLAKQVTKANCLSAAQVKEVMELFDFEETRLDFAKFAYDYTVDQSNYYKVNDAFQFEMTIDELDTFIQSR
jgi:hypothetical protein